MAAATYPGAGAEPRFSASPRRSASRSPLAVGAGSRAPSGPRSRRSIIARMANAARYARVRVATGEHFALVDGENASLLDGAPWLGGRPTGKNVRLSEAAFACPVTPRTIFGIGKNYRAHAVEMSGDVPTEPLVFAKTVTSLLGP